MDTQEKGEEVKGRGEETKTEASDGKKGEKPASPPASAGFWELFRFADQLDYVLMAIGTVGAIVHGCSLPLFMRVMAGLINSFGANQNNTEKMMHGVIQYALYYLIVGASVWASSWAEISCWMWTAERQSAKMRIKYLEAALSQDIEFYDTEMQTSDVVLAINTDAVLVQNAIGEKFGNFIHHMAVFVAGFVVGFTSVWRIALMTIVMLPFLTIFGGLSAAVVARLAAKSQKAHSQAGSISEQSIVQIRTVQAYVAESRTIQAYSAILKIAQNLGYKIGLGKGMGIGATYFIVFATYSLLLWYGGISIRHHFANGALVITAISAITMSGQAFMQCVPDVTAFVGGRAAAAKIFRIIDRKPSIDRNSGSGLEFDPVKGQVEFKNVNFSYPSRPDHQVLNNLSLTILAGKTIALIGSSGSGKSTVVSLIERFYDITSGQVLVDGHEIKTLNLRWLRQQIGLVSQEPALFATTIKENILFGRPEASMVEVEEAARVANAHSFIIKLPDGYDTQVGDKGTQMSGGQKQRIAIARAMLKNPSILLLDEATSALDSESEKLVQEALDRFMIGRTTLVIAHRLSTIRKADQVAVLEHGSLVEIGQHDDLIGMGDKSVYAKLIKLQESAHNNNAPKINARSSKRNSFSSPNSSFVCSPIIALNYSYGLSPSIDASRLSELSTPDIDQSFETAYPNNRHEKLAFKEHTSSFFFLRLAKMNSPEWPFALIGTICSVLCGSVNAIFAYVLSAIIGVYYNPDRAYMKKETAKYCYFLIGLSVFALIFCTLQHFFWDIVGENLTKRVKEKLLATVLKNEMGWFDQEENESSRVAGRLALDATNVRSAIGDRISLIMQNSALMLLACVVAFVLQWRLTLIVVSVLPFIIGATVLQKMFTQGFSGDLEAAHAKGTLLAAEAVANLRTVAAFNSESNMVDLFTSNLEIPLRRCFWKGQISGCLYGISQFCLFASNALALWYASWLVKQGMSDFSKSIRVFMILLISGTVAAETLILAPDLVKGGRAMHSVFELLDRKTQIESDDSNTTLISSRLQGEIEFKHVQFAYPSRPDVLVFRDLSFCARPGKTLALVGPSGCGKSSVIALIERFYEPFSGRILIDRKDIRKYNLKSLRRHIALVPQEPCLFATSIYDNIAYGHDSATEAEVIEAATLANAHKFISSLPDGYKTYAGERGVQLSGGQKQRIAIARAFLKKADIMLLDEATSALDSESESGVQVALDRVCDGKTTIVVAHKIATIKYANVIAVIDKGKIAEQGSHPQLLKNPDGIYARMTQLQISTHGQDVNYVEPGSSSTPPKEHQEG